MFKCLKSYISPKLKIIKYYRKARKAYLSKNNLALKYYELKIMREFNCEIPGSCFIGDNVSFPHPHNIVIGRGVVVGSNVTIYQGVTIGKKRNDDEIDKYPKVGDRCILYAQSTIVGDICLENHTIVGANSLLNKSTEENSVYAGVPAKRIF